MSLENGYWIYDNGDQKFRIAPIARVDKSDPIPLNIRIGRYGVEDLRLYRKRKEHREKLERIAQKQSDISSKNS